MRLIDADKIDFGKALIGSSDFAKYTREAAQKLIDEQPTAFNLDKVKEWLIANAMFSQEYIEPLVFLDDAIEIVKSGGIDTGKKGGT